MKALIITPYLTTDIRAMTDITAYDLILCADSAYLTAQKESITPHIVIGDFDHGTAIHPSENAENTVTVPCEKDDTNTMLCLKYAMEKGADDVTILGGIGGRLDHTFANLQTLAYAQSHGIRARLLAENDEVFLLKGSILLPKRPVAWYLSVFAYDGICRGVTMTGTKYEVENVSLDTNFPLGVSNEITEEFAEICVKEGRLLIILSKKD
jgi:thiamine pyrophosphokinase